MGTIHIDSSDKDLGCYDLINVKNCQYVKELLDEQIESERIRNNVSVREFTSDGNEFDHDHDADK